MTDIESELRDAMHAAVDDARCPQDALDLLRRRRTRRKARASAVTGGTATAILAAAAIAVALHGGGRPAKPIASAHLSPGPSITSPPAIARPSPSEAPPPPGWVRHPDGTGDYIYTPAAWNVGGDLTQTISPPFTWVVSTGSLPKGGSCAPTAALRKLPADGALFAVIEDTGVNQAADEPYTFSPRARTLGLGPLGGPYECWGVYMHFVLFQDGGRYFQVQTVFGRRASAALRAEVRRSLNTMHIKPLPAADQPRALCHAGQWTYCPQAVWAYQVIGAAHVLELGNLGSNAISGLDGNRSFGMWTGVNSRPTGGTCGDIARTRVCRIGKRLWWGVHGLIVWLAPASSPYSTPPVGPGLPTGRILARLIVASQRTPLPAS